MPVLLLVMSLTMQCGGCPGGESYLTTEDAAIEYLIECLQADSVYEETFPEFMSFTIEQSGGWSEDGAIEFHDVTIRENHLPGSGGDPNTAPVRDRFRVYLDGKILYYSPLPGMYISYGDFLEGRSGMRNIDWSTILTSTPLNV